MDFFNTSRESTSRLDEASNDVKSNHSSACVKCGVRALAARAYRNAVSSRPARKSFRKMYGTMVCTLGATT